MGFIPKRLTLQNLDEASVYIEDTNNEYFNVQEVPETLTQGRYAFKIFGSDLLREGVELKIELLDAEGNTIFLTPVDFIGEEVPPYVPYRYVTVEVYSPPINVPGLATLTILGELNPDAVDVPSEFQNAYNVRYQETLNVDLSTAINTQPIRFFKNPTTDHQEVVQAKTILAPLSESIVTATVDGISRSDLKGKIIEIESGSLEKESLPKEVSDTFQDLRRFKDEYKYKTGLRGNLPAIIKRRGLSTIFASKEEPKFKLKSKVAIFKADMQGGTVEIPERTVTIKKIDTITNRLKTEEVTVPRYKSKILEVIDEKTIIPERPPLVTLPTGSNPAGTDITEVTIEDFSETALTASFNNTPTSVLQSGIQFDSMLDLTIKNMRTFSGDIYRVRVHGKSESAKSDFTVLADTIVESPELLKDSDSSSGALRTGYFLNQNHINVYWNSSSFDGSTRGGNVRAFHTGSHFIDSLRISGSTSGQNESIVIETNSNNYFTLRKSSAYTISAKVKGITTSKVIDGNVRKAGKLYFHLSGSNINTSNEFNSHTYFGAELSDSDGGQPVVLQLDDDIEGIQNFETIEHTFTPKFNLDKTANVDTILQIRAESGEWFISDLSLRPAMDTGFSPDEFKIKVPIPRTQRPDRFDFLIEYFDINNNVAETVTTVQDVAISGSAFIIDGSDNLLTGSLFMGNAADSGIEAAGINSAFVRSVGYEGFESASLHGKGGFMIFSGSVLPDESDNYEGAGIEIHDGTTGVDESYLKFRTKPSLFDVKTSTFFLGKTHSPANFISGSQGNLQISSSNFELTADGDVSMSGEITATGGTIGGFNIASSKISTTGVELGNSTEDLFISSSAFKVDHDGNITASNIDLGGTISATSGDIGGWIIEDGQLSAGIGNSAVSLSADLQIIAMGTGSTFNKGDLGGGLRMGIDTDGVFKFAVGSAASYLYADASGVSIKTDSFDVTASVAEIDVDIFKLSATQLFISSSEGGFIRMGSTLPTDIDGTNKGIYMQGSNNHFLVGNAAGGHLKFDGTNTSISSSDFYFGNDTNFISGSTGNIKIFSTGDTTLSGSSVTLATPKFYLGSTAQFISGSDGNIEISSSNFHVSSSGEVNMLGTITATAGAIGGFTIGNDLDSTAGTLKLKGASGQITASAVSMSGAITATSGLIGGFKIAEDLDSSVGTLKLKGATGQITASSVSMSGAITATSGLIGGFKIAEDLDSTAGTLKLKGVSGQITASAAQITGKVTANSGAIGGFTINSSTITATNFTLDPANKSITLGSGTDIFIADGDVGIHLGHGTFGSAPFSVTKAGVLKATSGTIGGFTLSSDNITATNFTISPSGKSISLGTGDNIFIVDGDVGMQLGDATFDDAPFSVTKAGVLKAESGTIGGWSLSSNTIVGSNLTLRSSGVIETNDFASGVQGFRLDSANNGEAEFENVKIRGTLSTTVFEKELVSAVGGQLYVANSSALTGSLTISASAATMSLVNVSGFTGSYGGDGEILTAKKISSTGFSTEYIFVQSASRNNPTSDTDFSGDLFVIRGYSGSIETESGSVGDSASPAQTYAPGQVFASTGRIGTGYIRLNANPNDVTTPYMDIVERTGSGVYDVDLKVRVGDLSGLSTTKLHGTNPASAGFGLYGQNVFLEGGIVANTGSIGGINMESGKLYVGDGTYNNSNTAFYVDSTGDFSLEDKFVWDASENALAVEGSITITGGPSSVQLAQLNATTASLQSGVNTLGEVTSSLLAATASLQSGITSLGSATASLESGLSVMGQATASLNTSTGSLGSQITGAVDSGSLFASNAEATASLIGVSSNASSSAYSLNAVESGSLFATSAVESGSLFATSAVASSSLFASGAFASASIQSSSLAATQTANSESIASRILNDISGSLISPPAPPSGEGLFLSFPHMGFYSGSEFQAFISASGGFLFKADDNNLISFGQSTAGGDGSTTKSFVLKSDNVFLSGSNVNILGERFFLGGGSQFVSGSNGNIEISSSNFHLKPDGDVIMDGTITANAGTIGGFAITPTAISSSDGSLTLNADGGITGSKFLLSGGIITDDVTIEGSLSANSISTPTGGSPKAIITDKGFASFVSASIGGFNITNTTISDQDSDLVLNSDGQITASNALITGNINITGGSAKNTIDSISSTTGSFSSSLSTIEQETGSLFQGLADVSSSVSGAFTDASASLATDLNTVESNVSGAFTSVSESITSRILTDISGSILETPPSPSGEGLFLNHPHMGFYGRPTITKLNYTVTANGSSNYIIDGAAQPALTLQVGYTYVFDISDSSNSGHPFRIGTSANGSAITDGVTITSDALTIVVSSSTPTTLYYFCTAHSGMGAQVNIVDNSEFKAFISASGGFLFKADDNNLISFGQSVSGGDGVDSKSFVLKADNVFMSGSKINMLSDKFFLGGESTFVSGSSGNIEISSSRFHLQPDGDVVMNDITASNARFSGHITINAGPAADTLDSIADETGSLQSGVSVLGEATASLLSAATSSIVGITAVGASAVVSASAYGDGAVASGSLFASNAEATSSLLGASAAASASAASSSLVATRTAISASTVARIMTDASGKIVETPSSTGLTGLQLKSTHLGYADNGTFNAFIGSSGNFLFKNDANNLISFGQSATGGDGASSTNFVLRAQNVFMSGSSVNMLTDKFFFGNDSTFISGSEGNITVSGSSIELLTPKFYFGEAGQYISGSGGNIEISSSMFHLDPQNNKVAISGSITATDGTIGGMRIDQSKIESVADAGDGSTTTLVVTANGSSNYIIYGQSQPTLNFIPGNTYRFDLSDDSNSGHPLRFTLSDGGTDYYTTGQTVNGSPGSGGAYVELDVTQDTPTTLYYRCTSHGAMKGTINVDKTSPLVLDGNTGQITGSRFLFEGGRISGSNVDVITPKFFFGDTSQFISGSEGNIEISSSNFHLTSDGNVTMSGEIRANAGTLGGFQIGSTQINDSDGDLILKSSGQISASAIQLTGEVNIIGGSAKGQLDTLGEVTASLELSTILLNESSASLLLASTSSFVSITAVGASSVASASAYGDGAVASGSLFASNAEATSSLIGASSFASSSAQSASLAAPIAQTLVDSGSMADSVQLTNTGMNVLNGSSVISQFGATVTIGENDDDKSRMVLDDDTLDLIVDVGGTDTTHASFGTTTTVGSTSGRHVKITGTALEIKTSANNTVLSASAAGLEMSGSIIAASGRISNFSITSGSIDSNVGNVKRGIKLEPGKSIRGYGNVVHTTTTVAGKFSFGVAAVSPPVDAPPSQQFSSDFGAAQAPGGDQITT